MVRSPTRGQSPGLTWECCPCRTTRQRPVQSASDKRGVPSAVSRDASAAASGLATATWLSKPTSLGARWSGETQAVGIPEATRNALYRESVCRSSRLPVFLFHSPLVVLRRVTLPQRSLPHGPMHPIRFTSSARSSIHVSVSIGGAFPPYTPFGPPSGPTSREGPAKSR
jgi:hypothetical protein